MMTQENKPIYTRLLDAMKNGRLPEGFEAEDSNDTGPQFYPGAKDGILYYHTAKEELTEEVLSCIDKAIQHASKNEEEAAYSLFKELTKEYPAFYLWDAVQESIIRQKDELNQSNVFSFAIFRMLLEGTDIECVKIGIIITEVFSEPVQKLKEVLRNLALYEEFTLYVICHMRNWQNPDEEMFEIAKKVTGWGRIFAAEYMEPVNHKIAEWFLYEGYKNDILSNYSALVSCLKCNLYPHLRNHDLTDDQYHAASRMIEQLTDETPLPGLSGHPFAEELLDYYLEEAAYRPLTEDEQKAFSALADYEGNVKNLDRLKEKYANLLHE